MHTDWTPEDSKAALEDGWEIFEQDATGAFQLQALDDAESFPNARRFAGLDHEAWFHVATQAALGSALHQHALDFLRWNSVQEYHEIMAVYHTRKAK